MNTTPIELLTSPWASTFFDLVRSATESLVIASPFLSSAPLTSIAEIINADATNNARVEIVTNLSVDHLLSGSLDVAALMRFKQSVPKSTVVYLPGLHAKVYIADAKAAVVTSGNLTNNGLSGNHEYGVMFRDSAVVSKIRNDLSQYASLGSKVSLDRLVTINEATKELKLIRHQAERSTNAKLRTAFNRKVKATQFELLKARAQGQTTHRIFCDTILYVLEREGALRTIELHPFIKQIHPDLCDDNIDTVIGDVHFGKKWKHHVRSAQVSLRRQGLIIYNGSHWSLRANT